MDAHAQPKKGRFPAARRRAIVTGAVTAAVLTAIGVGVFLLRVHQDRQAEQEYRVARHAIAAIVRGEFPDCKAGLERSREAMRGQMRRARVSGGLLNKKAVVYDLALKEALAICEGLGRPAPPENTICRSVSECRDAALALLFNGRYEAAGASCRMGLGLQDDGAMRAMLQLTQDMMLENAGPQAGSIIP